MTARSIIVGGNPFFGRDREQEQFRAVIRQVPPSSKGFPQVFLLYGNGGIGKTTLARRFEDIAKKEDEFKGQFQSLWVDWEAERIRFNSLNVGRDQIAAETVFRVIHAVASRKGWSRHFKEYQKIILERQEVEAKAAAALESVDEKDQYTLLRKFSSGAIAKLFRLTLPIGEVGEQITQSILDKSMQMSAKQLAEMRSFIDVKLKQHLSYEQYKLYLNPEEQLALALANGLKKVAKSKPLLLFLDTYELIDQTDSWTRILIKSAGPRIIWIISGRNDLSQSGRFGSEYFIGYSDDFPQGLCLLDMTEFAQEEIGRYFAARVPNRPMNEEELKQVCRATQGIPLAVRQATDIWASGAPIEDIVAESDERMPSSQIVRAMTDRYLKHCLNIEADEHALYALALADGNLRLLEALLRLESNSKFNFVERLRDLQRKYASVHLEQARLHDEPARFFRQDMRENALLRQSIWVKNYYLEAIRFFRQIIEEINEEIPLLEDRCVEEEWVQATLDLADHLFWIGGEEAWQWFIPRFIEGLAYNHEMRQGLLNIIENWAPFLPKTRWLSRLDIFLASKDDVMDISQEEKLLQIFALCAHKGWFLGKNENERQAIIELRRARLKYYQIMQITKEDEQTSQYLELLRFCLVCEEKLVEENKVLLKQLGDLLQKIARGLMWLEAGRFKIPPQDIVVFMEKATKWQSDRASAWLYLGSALMQTCQYEKAIDAFQEAIHLLPQYANAFNGIGNAYRQLGRYRSSIDAYLQAIELNPDQAIPYNGLGYTYYHQGDFIEATEVFEKAILLSPSFVHPICRLGNVYHTLGNLEKASFFYHQAIEKKPNYVEAYIALAALSRQTNDETAFERYCNKARELFSQEEKDGNYSMLSNYMRAGFASMTNTMEESLKLLKEAIETSPGYRNIAQHDPIFFCIRDNPQFQALVNVSG